MNTKIAAKYWGRNGAVVILRAPTGRILLLKRSKDVADPNMWGIPGGRVEIGSTPIETVNNEVTEEIGDVPDMQMSSARPHMFRAPDADFRYGTYLAHVPSEFKPKLNPEHTDHTWIHPHEVGNELQGAPVHPNVSAAISHHFPNKNKQSQGSQVLMNTLKQYIKLANLLDKLGHYDAAGVVDGFIRKKAIQFDGQKWNVVEVENCHLLEK